jgi:hypothetical protein
MNFKKYDYIYKIIKIPLAVLLLVTLIIIGTNMFKTKEEVKELIFFDTGYPNSFDPLDADKFINMSRARMLFATPIEVSYENKLTSNVLSEFSYDREKLEIKFIVKENIFYSDNSKITVDDIVFSILRMAQARPDFPVLRKIVGIKEWLEKKDPLKSKPTGISIEKNEIKIKLTTNTPNPLFRFSLELFSIIPRSLINPDTNKLIGMPPSSGYYKIESSDINSISFTKIKEVERSYKIEAPSKIKFKYISVKDLSKEDFQFSNNAILTGLDVRLDLEGLSELRNKFKFKYLPNTRFKTVLINPNIPPFDNAVCRRQFARELRKTYSEFQHKTYTVSASVFSKVIPGYRDDEFFEKKFESDSQHKCEWNKFEIPWTSIKDPIATFDNIAVFKTLIRLGVGFKVLPALDNLDQLNGLFKNNKVAFDFFRSGFWAQDAIGDTEMIFTPNMHDPLHFVNQNLELRKSIQNLDHVDESNIDDAMASVNLSIYKDSTMVPVLHSRVFYAANNIESINELPQAVVHPAPWQVFNLNYDGK